ncbi:MAG: ROK family protein [Nanoarchaeota archaeon]
MNKIFVDLGGSKTIIKFSNKETFEKFLSSFKKESIEEDKTHNYVIIPSSLINEKEKFFSFIKLLNNFGEVYLVFPEPIYKEKIYSKKFPFLNGKSINELKEKGIAFLLHDIKALATFLAYEFFKNSANKKKKLGVVILGTGINALSLSYYEFKEGIYLDKLYEAGHSIFVYNGKMCHCGREGCVDRYLSGRYLKESLKVEEITTINHIPSKKEEFHKRLAYFLSSLIITQGIDHLVLYGGLTNLVDLVLLKNFIDGIIPFGIELEYSIEINNDKLAQIKGLIYFVENLLEDKSGSKANKTSKNNKNEKSSKTTKKINNKNKSKAKSNGK